MDVSELDFLEEMLHANELLRCANCDEETLHAHEEILESWPHATEIRMRCTCCGTSRTWVHAK